MREKKMKRAIKNEGVSEILNAELFELIIKSNVSKNDLIELEDKKINFNSLNSAKKSALHIACALGNKNLVLWLLDLGADVNIRDMYDMTPLHYAAKKLDYEILMLLLSHGADPSLRDNSGVIPLFCCLEKFDKDYKSKNSRKVVEKLIQVSDINSSNSLGRTPLMTACNWESMENVKMLLKYNPDMFKKDNAGDGLLSFCKHEMYSFIAQEIRKREIGPDQDMNIDQDDYIVSVQDKVIDQDVNIDSVQDDVIVIQNSCRSKSEQESTEVENESIDLESDQDMFQISKLKDESSDLDPNERYIDLTGCDKEDKSNDNHQIEQIVSENETLKNEIERMKSENDRLKTELISLRSLLDEKTETINANLEEILSIKTALESKEEENEHLNLLVKSLESEKTTLNGQLHFNTHELDLFDGLINTFLD